jgi:fibrillarin-like pre-rRNA processing protein
MDRMKVKEVLHNVVLLDRNGRKILATKSRYAPHYGEKKYGEFREWMASRSKLAALILKEYVPEIKEDWKILYLGAASGTTVSHFADIVEKGVIFAVEYSAKPFSKFLELAMERKNIIPILANALQPWKYSGIVDKVDMIYQDVAHPEQVEIFERNADFFLKKRGEGLIMVKARSIDSTAEPKEVFTRVKQRLKSKFRVLAVIDLEPYHKDHVAIHIQR